ncbi:MAG: hypothetical protein HXS54_06210 [Theionarchaea archaeon]|nr:hypothetical protein [Theionarchaea archaeon]DBA34852.1 TPA_asm: hypothetical protein vir521_00058 [Caudoviricetes sp. vir521]
MNDTRKIVTPLNTGQRILFVRIVDLTTIRKEVKIMNFDFLENFKYREIVDFFTERNFDVTTFDSREPGKIVIRIATSGYMRKTLVGIIDDMAEKFNVLYIFHEYEVDETNDPIYLKIIFSNTKRKISEGE